VERLATQQKVTTNTNKSNQEVPPLWQSMHSLAEFAPENMFFLLHPGSDHRRDVDPIHEGVIRTGCRRNLVMPELSPVSAQCKPLVVKDELDFQDLYCGRQGEATTPWKPRIAPIEVSDPSIEFPNGAPFCSRRLREETVSGGGAE